MTRQVFNKSELFYQVYQDLTMWEEARPYIERIWDLVQENPEFFGNIMAGERKLPVAVRKLESMVNAWKRQIGT